MSLLHRVSQDSTPVEITRPDAESLIAGDPVHSTWNIEDDAGLYCGMWQSTPALGKCLMPSGNISTSTKGTRF